MPAMWSRAAGWNEKRVSVTGCKQSDNLLGSIEEAGGNRANERKTELAKTEMLKRHEDNCQVNDNYNLREKKKNSN